MNIRHVVCWKLASDDPAQRSADARAIKEALESLSGRVPGLLEIEVGIDVGGDAGNYDVVLNSLFSDAQALAAYQASALHAAAGRRVVGGVSGRVAVDYHVGATTG